MHKTYRIVNEDKYIFNIKDKYYNLYRESNLKTSKLGCNPLCHPKYKYLYSEGIKEK